MSERVDRLCDNVKARFDALDASVDHAKTSVSASTAKTAQAVMARLDEAKHRIQLRMRELKQERARLRSRMKQELTEAKAVIDQWKASRNAEQLGRRADRAEQYALAAILDATEAVDEAEVAALEALDARLMADEARSSPPQP